jgi:hypothetical protein
MSEEAWREIEETIPWPEGLSGDELDFRRELLRNKVRSYLHLYYGRYDPGLPVRPRHKRMALEKIARQAEDLAALVDPDTSKSWGEALKLYLFVEIEIHSDNASDMLRDLAERARNAAAKLPADKGGRRTDLAFENFVSALATLYTDLTRESMFFPETPGREPGISQSIDEYGGPFFRFVETIYRHALPGRLKAKGPTALGKALQRALEKRRFRHGLWPASAGQKGGGL